MSEPKKKAQYMMQVMTEMGKGLPRRPPPSQHPRFVVEVQGAPESFEVTDLQGNLMAEDDALLAYDSFHFEVRFENPIDAEFEPMIQLALLGPNNSGVELMNLFFLKRDSNAPLHKFQPFRSVEDAPDRFYQFYAGYNVFYLSEDDAAAGRAAGVEFCVMNTHIRRDKPELDPTWELRLDDDVYLSQHLKNCKGMPRPTPINALYGRGLEPWERAQGDPFWYFWRKGRCIRDPATNIYYLLDDEEYEELGGRQKLMRGGGSGAYKQVGKYCEDERFMTSIKPRTGTQLEPAVRAAQCFAFPDITIEERGWMDAEKIEGYHRPVGMSPDGLMTDPAMNWDSVYQGRKDKWMAHWKEQGMTPKQIRYICESLPSLGLWECKVTDGVIEKDGKVVKRFEGAKMSDYYILQITWNMMVKDLYWTRVTKLNLNGSELRSYTVFRDFDREKQLVEAMIHVQDLMLEDPALTLPLATKCKLAKAMCTKVRNSARWYNDNQDKCSVAIKWDVPVVRGLFAWRRRTRLELRGELPPAAPNSLKERLTARLLGAPRKLQRTEESAMPGADPRAEQRVRVLVDCHDAVMQVLSQSAPVEPFMLQSVIMRNMRALMELQPQ